MVSYTYDSWGKPHSVTGTKAATLGVLNPFRYRGYVYDEESGWYYLKSRYYDSEVGRFLNADGYISTGNGIKGYNMYSYCGKNPLNHADDDGNCYYNINGGIIKDPNCNKLWCKRVNGKYLPSNMVSNDYKNLMDFGMHPINDRRILSVIIQRQVKEMPMLELEFSGLKYLRLFPVDEIYTCEILEASLFMKDGYIYWSDREIDSAEDSRDRDGTLVCAAKLRWRPIAKNFSDQLYYVNCK